MESPMRKLFSASLLLVLGGAFLVPATSTGADLASRRKAFDALLSEHWNWVLSQAPEFASTLGDRRWNDKSSDNSAGAIAARLAETRKFLDRFEAVDTEGFPEQEALTKTLVTRDMKDDLANAQFNFWQMPVNQMSGIHLYAGQAVSVLPFETVKDYDDYVVRLRGFSKQMDDTIANMRLGMAAGLMPPGFLLEKVADQAASIGGRKPEETPFARPLDKMPASFSEVDRTRLRAAFLAAIAEAVIPAYKKFEAFVRAEYAPKGRKDPGIWSLPDGGARYAALIKDGTTTTMSADAIHRIGLSEVARIEAEMLSIAKAQGYSDLKTFNAAIEKMPELRPTSREQMLQMYRGFIEGMKKEAPKLFGRLPKADCIVVPVEDFREKEAAGAEYIQGTPDGSRPGQVEVNTGDFASRKTISFESTAYHEGVPGHHFQIAIRQELGDLPPVRQQLSYNAFEEGWALYSERLGKDVGFYKNPYSDYGRLQDEMLRAVRLVVDTGLHAKKWTRDQVVQFFHDHTAQDEVDLQAETDRYIVWPGQALGYKIGQLKILELRERAKKALGPRFDIRNFHDAVLGAGSLPLDVLEARIDSWIKTQ